MNATDGINGQVRYVEYQVPFCSPFTCATHVSTANGSHAVLWDCLPTVCRRRIEGFVALLFILAVLTTIFNAVVLAANSLPSTRRLVRRNPTMENYAIYVMSMALADLLVGAVVLPTVLGFLYMELSAEIAVTAWTNSSTEANTSFANSTRLDKVSNTSGSVYDLLSSNGNLETMMNSAGVVTHLAIFVSMYTLAAASADRFYTSTKPVSNRSIILSG